MIVDKLMNRWVEHSFAEEKRPIRRKHFAGIVAWMLVLLISSVGTNFLPGVAGTAVGLVPWMMAGISVTFLVGIPQKLSWGRGYRAGRESWVNALAESQRRGLHPTEWLVGEMQRDGIPAAVIYDEIDERPVGIRIGPYQL